jgi:tetratricopeptide (TPR) repeat protein
MRMPPQPSDRAELLRQAAEGDRALREIPSAGNAKVAGRRAGTQYELGRIRNRLGESREAERLFAEAASGFWELGHREFSALARFSQVNAAVVDGRTKEALTIMERTIEQFEGFPKLENTRIGAASGLSMWLWLLGKANDQKRLYEAAGIALGMLDPSGSTKERVAFGKALAWRARSADALGYKDEAAELYEKAIASLAREEPNETLDALLDDAISRAPQLLSDLERDEEAAAAYARTIERFETKKKLSARVTLAAARLWLRGYARCSSKT